MRCQFLRDARVKYCQASPFRKLLLEAATKADLERCSSAEYIHCPAAVARLDDGPQLTECPFLQDADAEFCAASPVPRFIPAHDGLLSRCKSDSHLYCEVFLAAADARGSRLPERAGVSRPAGTDDRTPMVDGVPVPAQLSYAPNHMWLDVADDGLCHVGIDGFLARVLQEVDGVAFVTARTVARPVAVLSVHGVELQMMFPNALQCSSVNYYLRSNPEKLCADPYGSGWLFEGTEAPFEEIGAGLISGARAAAWMRSETARLSRFVHERTAAPAADGSRLMADGGSVEPGFTRLLSRQDLIELFTEFFSPANGWRRSW